MAADDEIEALQGIFCGEGEFEILSDSGPEWQFCICVTCQQSSTGQSQDSTKTSLQCFLPIGYPHVLPAVSLASDSLTKHSANQLQEELHDYAKTLCGQPMIMDLVYWVQENAWRFAASLVRNESTFNCAKGDGKPHVAILHIDHMRSRVRYTKTLVSWASELCLTGRLLFLNHLILVLLIGEEGSIKDFLVRLRTQKVDIDSSGRSCKERMMTVLMQGTHPRPTNHPRISDFQVLECSTPSEMELVFSKADLQDFYKETLMPKFNLLHTPAGKTVSKS